MENKSLDFGTLVLSLDFEMMWGLIDCYTPEGYGMSNVSNVPLVIEKIIGLLDKYSSKATFGTVGFILAGSLDYIMKNRPDLLPTYDNKALSPYEYNYFNKVVSKNESLFFSSRSIESLIKSKCIEVGSHTYCHYYCWEDGQSRDEFEADLKQFKKISDEHNLVIESIIFPRNQVPQNYLEICSKYGIIAYRGNARSFFGKTNSKLLRFRNKMMRFLDTYVNIAGLSTIPYSEVTTDQLPINIPASRLLRPYNRKLSFLEGLKLRRIKKEIKHAAQNHEIYHLWWHPHNFGNNIEQNIILLDNILSYYQKCHIKYGMKSLTMGELAQLIRKQKL